MELTVVELFAGVGGFRVGLNKIKKVNLETGKAIEEGSWDFIWANQFEPSTKVQHAYECYTTRFGENSCSNEDIHLIKKDEIPRHSLLVGGFPCQDYSVARSLSNEKGIEGKKGVLFWDIRDILVAKNSPFVLLENVDRLLKSPANIRGRDFAVMLRTFHDLDYYVEWRVINAAEYGMPQKRKRVFIFAYKNSTKYAKNMRRKTGQNLIENNVFNVIFPIQEESNEIAIVDISQFRDIFDVSNSFKEGKFLETGSMINGIVTHYDVNPKYEDIYSLYDILEKAEKYSEKKESFVISEDKIEKWKYLKGSKKVERKSKTGHIYTYSEGSMNFPENLKLPARTMLTSEGTLNRSSHIIFDSSIQKYRILMPVECELIQMFPPYWTNTMPNRSRYFMMGNALVTGIISRLERRIKEIIENE